MSAPQERWSSKLCLAQGKCGGGLHSRSEWNEGNGGKMWQLLSYSRDFAGCFQEREVNHFKRHVYPHNVVWLKKLFGWHYSHHVVWVKTPSSACRPTKHSVLGPVRTMLLRKASWKKWKTWRWVTMGHPARAEVNYAGAGRVHPKKERRLPTSSNPRRASRA